LIFRALFPELTIEGLMRRWPSRTFKTAAEEPWKTKPLEYIRRSLAIQLVGQKWRHTMFDYVHSRDRTTQEIIKSIPLENMTAGTWPAWILIQLYHFFGLMNGLFKLIHVIEIQDARDHENEDVNVDEFRSSVADLMDILAAPRGITFIRNTSLPIGGPGANPDELESIFCHHLHSFYFPLSPVRGYRGVWRDILTRVKMMTKRYVVLLRKYRPSGFLALTPNSCYVRFPLLADKCMKPPVSLRENGRWEIRRALDQSNILYEVRKDTLWECLEIISHDLKGDRRIAWHRGRTSKPQFL
jgi:hypothetical protein